MGNSLHFLLIPLLKHLTMKPATVNLINALILIGIGLWGAMSSTSPTAYIAPGFGALFLLLYPGFKSGNKIIVHVVVLFTFILIFALASPLLKAINAGDQMRAIRVGIMLGSCIVASIIYIKSFIDARRNPA